MKISILILSVLFSITTNSQDIYGYMMRIKSDSFTYKAAMRNRYLYLDTSGEFKNPTRKEHHILRICIPKTMQNNYPILYTYFSKDSCNNIGIKIILNPAFIEKIRTVIQAKYK